MHLGFLLIPQAFWMPLNADEEWLGWHLDRLDNPVW